MFFDFSTLQHRWGRPSFVIFSFRVWVYLGLSGFLLQVFVFARALAEAKTGGKSGISVKCSIILEKRG